MKWLACCSCGDVFPFATKAEARAFIRSEQSRKGDTFGPCRGGFTLSKQRPTSPLVK